VVSYVIAIVLVAFIFDFINGFHDSANSIATVVGTRVLSPITAVVWAAFFNFAAAFTVGTAVARTVGKGMIDVNVVTPNVILAGLAGAIVWNLITWVYGLPSSSSHALLGGYAGAAVAKAGFGAIIASGWTKTLVFIVLSPVIGMAAGFGLMVGVYWAFRNVSPARVDALFRRLQLGSAALFSLSHGANDAQKTMGIIVGLLVSTQDLFVNEVGWLRHLHLPNGDHIPLWIEMGAYSAIALGTLLGGWRIVHTMGSRITKLRPVGGACAETGGALSILLATRFGIPVSTTHTITGAIVGVGATQRLSAVRWGVAGRIVWAWLLTIPAAAIISALALLLLDATSGQVATQVIAP
jgi:PiT family inorganic phosphate transporter